MPASRTANPLSNLLASYPSPAERLRLLKAFTKSSYAEFVTVSAQHPIFTRYLGNRTPARICAFPGANTEQKTFDSLIGPDMVLDIHYLHNIVLHRLFFLADMTSELKYNTDPAKAADIVRRRLKKGLPIRTNAYQRSIKDADMIAMIPIIYREMVNWWKVNKSHAFSTTFPIHSLYTTLRKIPNLGDLSAALCMISPYVA
ncbi:hypothetical protein HDV00_001739 [Rhizophlyctis rosea]|nr:hypothetical protein HDV00_001739 [Rhizophlyctis rosea]